MTEPHPTDHLLKVLAEYLMHSDQAMAASCFNMNLQTFKNNLTNLYKHLDVNGAVSAGVKLGWIRVPDKYNVHMHQLTLPFWDEEK